jgi:hypothetical protein
MSHDRDNPDRREGADDSAHESASAFGDGVLPPDAEAGAIFADLRRLREWCRSVPPPEPEEAAWTATLTRLHDAVRTAKPRRRRSPRPVWAVTGLAAAAALIAVLLSRPLWMKTPTPLPQPPVEEPFPVAEADDVDIISIDARDVAGLVVGEPPVSGELIFARQEDVRVIKCQCCPVSGNLAELRPGEVPMLVTSAAPVGAPDDK